MLRNVLKGKVSENQKKKNSFVIRCYKREGLEKGEIRIQKTALRNIKTLP